MANAMIASEAISMKRADGLVVRASEVILSDYPQVAGQWCGLPNYDAEGPVCRSLLSARASLSSTTTMGPTYRIAA